MHHLTMGIRSEKCIVRRFRHSANVIKCTYTNLGYMVQPIAARLQTCTACYCTEYYRPGMSNMWPFASTPAARTKDTVIWSFNGQNCSFYNFYMFATRIMAMFGSTYVCEQLFSFMKSTKTFQRTRLTD